MTETCDKCGTWINSDTHNIKCVIAPILSRIADALEVIAGRV